MSQKYKECRFKYEAVVTDKELIKVGDDQRTFTVETKEYGKADKVYPITVKVLSEKNVPMNVEMKFNVMVANGCVPPQLKLEPSSLAD